MCAGCGHPYWLTQAETPVGPLWELEEREGTLREEGEGGPRCPLCGGPLVEDPLAEL